MQSFKYRLNLLDWQKWALNFVIFCAIPSVIAFIGAYSLKLDVKYAFGVALGTFYGSAIDLYKKFVAGLPTDETTPTV